MYIVGFVAGANDGCSKQGFLALQNTLMDDRTSRIGAYFLLPAAFVFLLPFLLLFIVAFYLLALGQGVYHLLPFWSREKESNDPHLQKPHFLEAQQTTKPPANHQAPP